MSSTKDLMMDSHHSFERLTYHVRRSNFRIVELHLTSSQEVPWHRHHNIEDTFYVLSGSIRVEHGDPRNEVCLMPGQTFTVQRGQPHRVTAIGGGTAAFLALQGIGEYDFVLETGKGS